MKLSTLYIPADCVSPRTANLDAQYALSEACPKKIRHRTRRNSRACWPTFLSRKGACTDNSPTLTLSYHLLCRIFIAVEGAFHVDRKHRLKVIGCRCGRISASSGGASTVTYFLRVVLICKCLRLQQTTIR